MAAGRRTPTTGAAPGVDQCAVLRASDQRSTHSVAMTRPPAAPGTVMRTGPGCTASKLNRPKRSAVCSTCAVGALERNRRRHRRHELADEPALASVDDHQLDLDAGAAERQLAGRVRVAHAGELGRRVEHQISELLVDRPPRHGATGRRQHVVGHGVGASQRLAEQFEQVRCRPPRRRCRGRSRGRQRSRRDASANAVGMRGIGVMRGGHRAPAFGSMPAGRSRRSLSRQRARLGPMLPIERPSVSAIVW